MAKKFKVVNNLTPSVDGKGLMQGRSAYTDDLAPEGALIVKLLRSPYAFAKVKSIDVSEALKVPGVECILTKDNVPHVSFTRAGQGYPEPSPHDKFVLDEYVRYVGDEVAVVAAETEEIALEAMKLIKVDYEVLEPVLNFEEAKDNKSVIHPEDKIHEMFPIGFEPKRNIAAAYEMEVGNVEEELDACGSIIACA